MLKELTVQGSDTTKDDVKTDAGEPKKVKFRQFLRHKTINQAEAGFYNYSKDYNYFTKASLGYRKGLSNLMELLSEFTIIPSCIGIVRSLFLLNQHRG